MQNKIRKTRMKYGAKELTHNEQVVAIFIVCYWAKKEILMFHDCLLLLCCLVSLKSVCYCVYIVLYKCPLLFTDLYLV
jgi:glucan phosphoethanolaminetransferase (alkaline phosphatase superfamily)